MGMCMSKPVVINEKIEAIQKVDQRKDDSIVKLLLLGAGDSGKSTIFRQMKLLYGKPIEERELCSLVPAIHLTVMGNFLIVLATAKDRGIEVEPSDVAAYVLQSCTKDSPITPPLAEKMVKLWGSEGMRRTWEARATYQVLDCLEYFMGNEGAEVTRLGRADYVPTETDVLRARFRTSGVVEESYNLDGFVFTILDVGGQRNERKKWIHSFDRVTAVIYVAALSEYDMYLFEDTTFPRVQESVTLFEEISNSPWFVKTSIILFLNKIDLFTAKLFKVPYRLEGVRNDDFTGWVEGSSGGATAATDARIRYITMTTTVPLPKTPRQIATR